MRTLYYYVPGLGGPSDWLALSKRLRSEPGHADDAFVSYGRGGQTQIRATGRTRLESLCRDVAADLALIEANEREAGRPFGQIVLVAQSMGALLARWAWLAARGRFAGETPGEWAALVTRIVLVAGTNRGILGRSRGERSPAKIVALRALAPAFGALGYAWPEARAGSDLVTDIRVTWIRYMSELKSDPSLGTLPQVIQLLGTNDDLVRREDSRDVEQFPRAAQIDVPGAAHGDILRLDPADDSRYHLLRRAIFGTIEATEPARPPEKHAEHLAFVVHGIRSYSYGWTSPMAKALKAGREDSWRVVTPTYGYFSALEFALPWTRRRKVRWFLDQYAQEVAAHPAAKPYFVGHSNGTYLLGHAMERVGAVSFERAFLASSPLPVDYPWADLKATARLGDVKSVGGSDDMVVGFLARGLRGLGMRDIGSGGYEGFESLLEQSDGDWVAGGHGAPVDRSRIPGIAEWVTGEAHVTGAVPALVADTDVPARSAAYQALSRAAPTAFLLGAVASVGATLWVAARDPKNLMKVGLVAGGFVSVLAVL